jgi:hypothetical protein
MLVCAICLLAQRLQLSVFDEGNRSFLQVAQLHRFLEAMVPTAPMLQCMEVRAWLSVATDMHRLTQQAAALLSSCMTQSTLDMPGAGRASSGSVFHAAVAVLGLLHGLISVAGHWHAAGTSGPTGGHCAARFEKPGEVSFSTGCLNHVQGIAVVAPLHQLLHRALGFMP